MARIVPESPQAERIDAALATWRQGDAALGKRRFTHIGNPTQALTAECAAAGDSASVAAALLQPVFTEVDGLVVISQTCDIVRSCTDRPFIEVAPLVLVNEDVLQEVKKGRRPVYAFVPGVADRCLVGDLDRIMTIEKSVVAEWTRTLGCETDQQVREFAQALARKRARFAFPDDFTALVRRLQKRLDDKHAKNSEEGRALRALREIRVRAAPAWDAEAVQVTFWFVRNDTEPDFEGKAWHAHLDGWLKLVPESGRFKPIDGLVVTLDDLTARDYIESDPLDLDHLSLRIDD